MKKYEVMFINKFDTEADNERVVKKYIDLITGDGGEVTKVNKRGINKLSYPKNGHTEGNYTFLKFNANPNITRLLDKTLKSDKEIISSLIISG